MKMNSTLRSGKYIEREQNFFPSISICDELPKVSSTPIVNLHYYLVDMI